MSSASVIVRAYNAEKYIRHAIESILNQDYNGYIEILVCYDEGTSDNTLSVIESFSKWNRKDREVSIYRHTHLTPFRSLLHGLARSKCDYIMILDYDNVMPPNYVSTMIENAEDSGAEFLFSNTLPIDERGSVIGPKGPRGFNFTLKDLILRNYIDASTIMLRRDYAEKVKSELKTLNKRFFDDVFEDWLIALLALKDTKPHYVEDACILYRIHEKNVTAGARNLYKDLDNLKREVLTLIAFYELRGRHLSREELNAFQISLMQRHAWSIRHLSKYKGRLKLLRNCSFLAISLVKVLEKLLL